MDPPEKVLEKVSIYIENGEIKDIGRREEVVSRQGSPDEEIECADMIAIPGMINTHTHLAMIALRGLAADRSDVLYEIFWPSEKALTAELTGKLALMGALEAVKSGSTLVAEHYFFAEEIAQAIEKVGLRGLVGHTVMSWDGPWVGEEELRKAIDFTRKWSKREGLVKPVLAPHSPETVSREWLRLFREMSSETGLLIHMHLAQSKREVEKVKKRTGLTPVRLLHSLGLLNEKVLAAHCLYVDEEEKRLLASTGTMVVLCPSVYMLAGEEFYAYDLLSLGGNVLIGTDSPCYNDGIDIFREVRNLVYGQRLLKRSSSILTAREVLELATYRSAELLGLKKLGRIAPGYKADIVLLKPRPPRLRPLNDPYSCVVYSTSAGDVDTVIIDGRVVVRGGISTMVNEEEVVREGERATKTLLKRAVELSPQLKRFLSLM